MRHVACAVLSCAIVVVLVLYALVCKHAIIDPDGNKKRHLTDEFSYAHFSRITRKNYWFNPHLLASHPVHVTLSAGDGLIIPAGWWHWIRSEAHTYAVNFWASEAVAADVKQAAGKVSTGINHTRVMSVIESYTGPVRVWDSSKDVFLAPEAANFKDRRIRPNEYIISLKGFELTGTVSPNEELLSTIRPHVAPPPVFTRATSGPIDTNVWISFGQHDTGLHRDDAVGMLVVLKGSKQVTLYPPRDTPLLRPYSVVPQWAAHAWPCAISPNLCTLTEALTREQADASFPSARLLYESISARAKHKAALLHFIKLLHMTVDAPLVWGCKLLACGTMRWEVYAYHFNYVRSGLPATEKLVGLLLDQHPYARVEATHPSALVHSYDIVDAPTIPEMLVNGNVHVYKAPAGTGLALPLFGEGTTVGPSGKVTRESTYVVGTRAQFTVMYMRFMTSIGFDASVATAFKDTVLRRYADSPMLCVHNKYDGNVFVQYLGVSCVEFLQFLKGFAYPERLYSHFEKHVDKYKTVPHEITIVFHGETRQPVRTAFYGTLTPLPAL